MKRTLAIASLSALLLGAAAHAHADNDRHRDRDRGRSYETYDRGGWHARQGYVSLDRIIADALRRYPGRVTEVELDDGKYEIEIKQRNGREVELEYSARTGRLLDVDFD